MTAPFPDNAWLTYAEATARWGAQTSDRQAEYLRNDPAVLASSEVVRALIGAPLREQTSLASEWASEIFEGVPVSLADWLSSFAPATATAVLARMLREARNAGLDEAARAIRAEAQVSPYHNGMTETYQRGLSDGFEAAAQIVDDIRALKEQPE